MNSCHDPSSVSPIRPRAVSVLCVIWIYVGASLVTSSGFSLVSFLSFASFVPEAGRFPFGSLSFGLVPWLLAFIVLGLVGVMAIRGALRLLSMEERGRRLLVRATWLTLVSFAAFDLWFLSDFLGRLSVGMAFWTLIGVAVPITMLTVTIRKLGDPQVKVAIYSHEHRMAVAAARSRAESAPPCAR